MSDSNARDHLDAKHEHDREQRIEAIKVRNAVSRC